MSDFSLKNILKGLDDNSFESLDKVFVSERNKRAYIVQREKDEQQRLFITNRIERFERLSMNLIDRVKKDPSSSETVGLIDIGGRNLIPMFGYLCKGNFYYLVKKVTRTPIQKYVFLYSINNSIILNLELIKEYKEKNIYFEVDEWYGDRIPSSRFKNKIIRKATNVGLINKWKKWNLEEKYTKSSEGQYAKHIYVKRSL